MKINLHVELKNFEGKTIQEEVEKIVNGRPTIEKRDVVADAVCINAIMAAMPEERQKPIEGTEKIINFDLAEKIFKAKGELELTAEEIAKIKKRVGLVYNTIIVGNVCRILEGANGKQQTK